MMSEYVLHLIEDCVGDVVVDMSVVDELTLLV